MVTFSFLPMRGFLRKFVIIHEIGTNRLPNSSNYGILNTMADFHIATSFKTRKGA